MLYVMSHLLLAAFRTLPLAFNSLITTCLSEDLEVHSDSLMYIFISFIKFAKVLAIITSDISAPFSLCSPSGIYIMHLLVCLMLFHRSLRLCSFFFTVFSFCSSDWVISIALSLSFLNLSSACSNMLFTSLIKFSF